MKELKAYIRKQNCPTSSGRCALQVPVRICSGAGGSGAL